MEYRNLGRTGLKVSELCLGTMQFGWSVSEGESFEILSAAFNAGNVKFIRCLYFIVKHRYLKAIGDIPRFSKSTTVISLLVDFDILIPLANRC